MLAVRKSFRASAFIAILFFLLLFACTLSPEETTPTRFPVSRSPFPTDSEFQEGWKTQTLPLTQTHTPYQYDQSEQYAELGKGLIPDITHSPDDKYIILSDGYSIRILDPVDYTQIAELDVSDDGYGYFMAISPDNRFIAVSIILGIEFYDLNTLESVGIVSGGNGSAGWPIFLPDSKSFIYKSNDRTTGGPYHEICLGDLSSENKINAGCFPITYPRRYHYFSPPALSPDGRIAAAGYTDSTNHILYLWDVQSRQVLFELSGQTSPIESLAFSPNGKTLAYGSDDGLIRLLDPQTGVVRRTIRGFLDSIDRIEYTPDGRSLIVSVIDRPDIYYQLSAGTISPIPEPEVDPLALQMLSDGYLLSGGNSRTLFSPDGERLAIAHGSIQIWDVSSQELLQTFADDTPLVITGMSYSPDGELLGVVTSQGKVLVWKAGSGELQSSFSIQSLSSAQVLYSVGGPELGFGIGTGGRTEQGFAFSPSGDRLAIGNGGALEVRDASTGAVLLALDPLPPPFFPTDVSFSADGKYIYAALNRNRDAAVWDAETGQLIERLALPYVDPNAFTATALHGNLFARSNHIDDEYWIELWDLQSGTMTKLPVTAREVEPLRFSSDGKFLMAEVGNRHLLVWRTDDGVRAYVMGNMDSVRDISLSPGGNFLASVAWGKAQVWRTFAHFQAALAPDFTPQPLPPTPTPYSSSSSDWPTATPQPTIAVTPLALPSQSTSAIAPPQAAEIELISRLGRGAVQQVVWSSVDNTILVTSARGIYQYRPSTLELIHTFELDDLLITDAQILPDGRLLAAGTDLSGSVQVWDALAGEKLAEMPGVGYPVISPDGQWLAYLKEGNGVGLWNLETDEPGPLLYNKYYSLGELQFSRDGSLLAVLRGKRQIRVWDLASGTVYDGVGGPEAPITDMQFSSKETYIAGAAGGSGWLWRLGTSFPRIKVEFFDGEINGNRTLFENTVTTAAVSPDETLAAFGTSSHQIWLYSISSRQILGSLGGHTSFPVQMAFSPDGKRLASTDQDGRLMVWDLSNRKLLVQNHEHFGPVLGMVARTDGDVSFWTANTVCTLDTGNGSRLSTTYFPADYILAASPTGEWVAVYGNLKVSLYKAANANLVKILPEEAPDVSTHIHYSHERLIDQRFYSAVFSVDGSTLATFGSGGFWVYELPSTTLIGRGDYAFTRKAAISADGEWLVASYYEMAGGPSLYFLPDADKWLSLDDDQLTSGSAYPQYAVSLDKRWIGMVENGWNSPSRLLLIDPVTGLVSTQLEFPDVDLASLAFSPDASLIAVGQSDGRVVLVDTASMEILATYEAHIGPVSVLAFTLDGSALVSGGFDGSVAVWRIPD